MTKEFEVPAVEGWKEVAGWIIEHYPNGTIILLKGTLGSGKTTLVKAMAARLGIEASVTSPTFSLMHRFGEHLTHYDLYRIDLQGFGDMGLFEELDSPGFHCVEWGEPLGDLLAHYGLPFATLTISIKEDSRHATWSDHAHP